MLLSGTKRIEQTGLQEPFHLTAIPTGAIKVTDLVLLIVHIEQVFPELPGIHNLQEVVVVTKIPEVVPIEAPAIPAAVTEVRAIVRPDHPAVLVVQGVLLAPQELPPAVEEAVGVADEAVGAEATKTLPEKSLNNLTLFK